MVLEQEVKISKVSEFSILPYTHNRKVGNLGKFSFASSFERSCNLDTKATKRYTSFVKKQLPEMFFKKKVQFAKFTGKHLCWSLFFNKVLSLTPTTLLKKRLQ